MFEHSTLIFEQKNNNKGLLLLYILYVHVLYVSYTGTSIQITRTRTSSRPFIIYE